MDKNQREGLGRYPGRSYRPPNQDEETDEIFYKQLEVISLSLALILMGNFNLPDVH